MSTDTIYNSILVITPKGKLLRVYCPFNAKVIRGIETLMAGEHYSVLSVKTSTEYNLLFVVPEGVYPHHFFLILEGKG